MLTATCADALALLPMALLVSQAVLIRDELRFTETDLGVAVVLFVAIGALTSTPAGRLVQRIGARAAMALAAGISAVALLGIALMAQTYHQLLIWMIIGGVANAVARPAATLAVTGAVPPKRQGLAFGVMQSAPPIAMTVSGFAVPLIGLTVGWRWGYGGGAAAAALFFFVAVRFRISATFVPVDVSPDPLRATTAIVRREVMLPTLAAAVGLASAAVGALAAFYVVSAVHYGAAPAAAGISFAIGSLISVASRVWRGRRADRDANNDLGVMALFLVTGSIGFVLLGYANNGFLLAAGTLLAFGAGWGWPGLFQLAVVRLNPDVPAKAVGVTMTGALLGSAIGPLAFGAIAEHVSFILAWWWGAGLLLAGATFIYFGALDPRPRPSLRRDQSEQA